MKNALALLLLHDSPVSMLAQASDIDAGLQQLPGDWALVVVPVLIGFAVFFLVWLVLSGLLRKRTDGAASIGGPSWQISKTFHIAGPGGEGSAQWGQHLEAAGKEGAARPLDPRRREHYLASWRQIQARFAQEPAEAVRKAEHLLRELIREGGYRQVEMRSTAGFTGDAEFGAALAGIGDLFRVVQEARAAGRGMVAAQAHRDASVQDLRHAMEMYQRAFEQCLGLGRSEVDAQSGVFERRSGGVSEAETTRERVLTEKLAREAMGLPYERPDATRILDSTSDVLGRFLFALLSVVAVTVLVGGVYIMLNMDAGSRSQGGRFYVAIIILVVLGALAGQFMQLLRRRRPVRNPNPFAHPRETDGRKAHANSLWVLLTAATTTPTDQERHFGLASLLVLLLLAIVLVGFAIRFP